MTAECKIPPLSSFHGRHSEDGGPLGEAHVSRGARTLRVVPEKKFTG